jgi:hypothetical protein
MPYEKFPMNDGIRTCANYPWVFESPQETDCADAALRVLYPLALLKGFF